MIHADFLIGVATGIRRVYKRSGLSGVLRAFVTELIKLTSLWRVLNPERYKCLIFFSNIGYWPNLRNPRSFNEKVEHHRLFNQHKLASLVSNKWSVRDYVASKGLSNILNEVYFVTDNPTTIPFDSLPNEFVIKSNYGEGGKHVLIVRDKSQANIGEIIKRAQLWFSPEVRARRCYGEPRLAPIRPLVIVERLLKDRRYEIPLDYKFFVFHGVTQFVEVTEKNEDGFIEYSTYNRSWERVPFTRAGYLSAKSKNRPRNWDELVAIAEQLGSEFEFCRVDLYNLDEEKIVFGEITLYPATVPFRPPSYDYYFGKLW